MEAHPSGKGPGNCSGSSVLRPSSRRFASLRAAGFETLSEREQQLLHMQNTQHKVMWVSLPG